MPEVTNPAACSPVIVWASAPAHLIVMPPLPLAQVSGNRTLTPGRATASEREQHPRVVEPAIDPEWRERGIGLYTLIVSICKAVVVRQQVRVEARRFAIEQIGGPDAQPQARPEVITQVEIRDRRNGDGRLEILQLPRRVVAVVVLVFR